MAQVCLINTLMFSFITSNTHKRTLFFEAFSGSKSYRTRAGLCLATKNTSTTLLTRQFANYPASSWTYDFVQSLKGNIDIDQGMEVKAKKLEDEVKSMIADEEEPDILRRLELIDDIQRLGLGYKFKDEIKTALRGCVSWLTSSDQGPDKSLYAAALCFRLLRQHDYEISQDVLRRFIGHLETCSQDDIKDMLSLHEASYFAFDGESFFDEAKALAKEHLQGNTRSSSVSEHVKRELQVPLHHQTPRLQARWYIDAYSKKSESNQVLLELAKLDFNMVQANHQIELKDMSRWWKELGLSTKLSFTRDRLVESFFWAVGMVYEPQFGNLRKELTKVVALITVIDDIYDVYGTLDELKMFTSAIERWDIKTVNELPGYMRICFMALYNIVNDMVYDTLVEHDHYILTHLTTVWGDMCKAFLKEKKWSQNNETPKFEKYLENGWVSVSGVVLLTHTYFLISQTITKQGLDALENRHNLVRWPSVILRLCNDLGTSKAELDRGETVSSILCIMHKKGVSEVCARREIEKLVEDIWKSMNRDSARKDCDEERVNKNKDHT